MNLDYSVLWIDDRPKQVSDVIEHIKVRLARKGFDLKVDSLSDDISDKILRKRIRNNSYDLLVVDFKMPDGERNGDELIRVLRTLSDSTDIVFYSSENASSLRKRIDVDGVYCANRVNLKERLEQVIHSTIKKVLDLNSMRGISLSQLADFDHLIDEAIELGYQKLVEQGKQEGIIDKICETAGTYHYKTHEKIIKMKREDDIAAYTSLLTSNPKFTILNEVAKRLDNEDVDRCLARLERYEEAIISPRNKLAHAMQKTIRDGSYILESRKREIKFSEEDFTSIRINLLEFRDNFKFLNKIISDV